jgi:hypothetical protein
MQNEIWEVARSPIHSRVIYIGTSKRLNDYYTPKAKYIENDKGRIAGSHAKSMTHHNQTKELTT